MTERDIKARLRDWHDELLALSRFGRSTCVVHQFRNPTCAFCTMERLRDALAAIEALEAEGDRLRGWLEAIWHTGNDAASAMAFEALHTVRTALAPPAAPAEAGETK